MNWAGMLNVSVVATFLLAGYVFVQRLTLPGLALAWLMTTGLAIWGTLANLRTASASTHDHDNTHAQDNTNTDDETRPLSRDDWHYHVGIMPVLEESAFRILPYYLLGTDAVWLMTGASIMMHKMPSLTHLVAITAAMLIFAKLVTIEWWAPIVAHATFNASVLVASAAAYRRIFRNEEGAP